MHTKATGASAATGIRGATPSAPITIPPNQQENSTPYSDDGPGIWEMISGKITNARPIPSRATSSRPTPVVATRNPAMRVTLSSLPAGTILYPESDGTPMADLVRRIPVTLVKNSEVGVYGAALAAAGD